ncbi:MAG TPA: LytTR family DNA-binding domain-containing protein [Rhodanobacteraceae bacterium]|jgi:two-component system response regulator AlgR|nr:LytTR family DNA-binding domain-containing protein [Rhodanobacteraceae bacterium]
MRILVADDEPLARTRMGALLAECEGVQVVASVGDGEAALRETIALKPDVLLADIAMPGMDGLVLAKRLLALPHPPAVIFCTAYDAHALSAYELRAADYLLKPVRIERLREALARAQALRAREQPGARETLVARVRGAPLKIPLEDVIYLTADEKYVAVHRAGETLLIEDSLKSIEAAFPDRFVRIHRNCLVPGARLLGLQRDAHGEMHALIAGTHDTPEVSRRNLAAVRKMLLE